MPEIASRQGATREGSGGAATAVLDHQVTSTDERIARAHRATRRDRLAIPALVVATTISNAGNNLTALAVPWFVLVTTGSAARTGIVAAAVVLATGIGGFLGGAVVDRIGFKIASIASDLASGFFVALIPTLYYLDALNFGLLAALAFLASLLDAPGWSARRSMLPELSRRAGTPLERANSVLEIGQAVASFAGPLLAGVLIAALSVASVLYLDTLSFVISAALVAIVIALPRTTHPARAVGGVGQRSIVREATDGLRFMAGRPLLRTMVAVSVIANLIFTPFFGVAVPVYVKRTWDDPRALGLLMAGFGIGALIGIGVYGAIGPRIPRYPVFVVGIIVGAAALWLIPTTSYLAVAVGGAIAMGIGLGPINVISMTVMQEIVPEELLGRVTGSLGAMSNLASPLGLLVAGVAIELFGVRPVMIASAAAFTVLVAATVTMPVFRELERQAAISGD